MPKKNVKTVAILGAGIGGLTAAEELSRKGFNVHVYERNAIVGGQARSAGIDGTGINGRLDLPCEDSWRIYGARYQNLFEVMRHITFGK